MRVDADSVTAYLRRAPKTELHVHLEGALRPERLCRILRRHGLHPEIRSADDLAFLYRHATFAELLEHFKFAVMALRGVQDVHATTLSGVSFTELLPISRYTTGVDQAYKAWWAIMGASPGSGTITINYSGSAPSSTFVAYGVDQFVINDSSWDAGTVDPNNYNANYLSTGTTITATASAFASNGFGYAMGKAEVATGSIEGTWTALSQPLYASAAYFKTAYIIGTDNSSTYSGGSGAVGAAIMELRGS